MGYQMKDDNEGADEKSLAAEEEHKELIDPDGVKEPKFDKDDITTVPIGDGTEMTVDQILDPLLDERNGQLILGRSSTAHKRWGKRGTLEIGAVGEHQDKGEDFFGRKVLMDAAFPHITFICGKRGSGKSYTLGLFAEELVRSQIGVGIVLVDPIGIFWSMKQANESRSEIEMLSRWGLSPHEFPEARVFATEGSVKEGRTPADFAFSIAVGEMTAEDWCEVYDVNRFKTQGLLIGTAIDKVRGGYQSLREGRIVNVPGRGNRYSIGDIVECIQSSLNLTSKSSGFTPQTRRSIIARFNASAGWGIFSVEGTHLRDIISPNRISILDVSDPRLGDAKRSLIAGILARKILSGRIYSARMEDRENYDEMDPKLIPVTWLLIDEAHIILPHNRQTPATDALIEYAKQGRRPGCALVLATQRPAATNDDILSQVDMLIGHNLALEDDMTALRRRVPAKLPPEFANSDFIRAIPVGTAIIADQRTQQRSFLLRLRPRMSHHSGSSAMPKALTDPGSRSRNTYKPSPSVTDIHPVGEPTPPPEEDEILTPDTSHEDHLKGPEVIEEIGSDGTKDGTEIKRGEGPFPGVAWGSTVLLQNHTQDELKEMMEGIPSGTDLILFSRTPPAKYPLGKSPNLRSAFWLSSTPAEGSIAPTGLQDLSSEASRALKETRPCIMILDGIEYLYLNNGLNPVQRLLETLHEKIFMGKHILILRVEEGLEESFLETLSLEMDHIITSVDDWKVEGSIGDAEPSREGKIRGTLDRPDLERMCKVLGLPTEGDEDELIRRILEYGEVIEGHPGTPKDECAVNDRLVTIIEEAKETREENEHLRNRLEALESRIRVPPGEERKGQKRRTVIIWEKEKDQEGLRKALGDLIKEVTKLKKTLGEKTVKDARSDGSGMDPAVMSLLKKVEEERWDSLNRLKELEVQLRSGLKGLKEERDKGAEPSTTLTPDTTKSKKKGSKPRESIKDQKKLLPEARTKKIKKPKARVVKKGVIGIIVHPRIGVVEARAVAKKTIRRSLLRGPREHVEEIVPIYLPILRYLVSYKGRLFSGVKDGDIFIDGILGEVIESAKGGMERSNGMPTLLSMTDLERRIFMSVKGGKREDTAIARRAGLKVSHVRRCLTSLSKKGIVRKETTEGNINFYSLATEIYLPPRPWTHDTHIHPTRSEGIEDPLVDPILSDKDGVRMIGLLKDVDIIQSDTVHYPYFGVKIVGEGRERWIGVDAVSGKIDQGMASEMKRVVNTALSERD